MHGRPLSWPTDSRFREGPGKGATPSPPPLLALVFLLELPFLSHRPLARDEAFSVAAACHTTGALWDALGQIDAPLGLLYFLLHVVLKIDDSVYAARLPSLLGVIAATAMLITTAQALWGRRAATCVGLVLIANPVTWEYANIVRPYALALVLAAVTIHLARRA